MLSNSSVGIPSDMWIPANGQLKPAVMKQVALGYERSLAKGMYTLSLETYYRKTNHIVDFVDNANIFLNNQIGYDKQNNGGDNQPGDDTYGTVVRFSKMTIPSLQVHVLSGCSSWLSDGEAFG